MNLEELHKRVAEDLWASFGYDSPEEHAVVLTKLISDVYIKEFIIDLQQIVWGRIAAPKILKEWEEK